MVELLPVTVWEDAWNASPAEAGIQWVLTMVLHCDGGGGAPKGGVFHSSNSRSSPPKSQTSEGGLEPEILDPWGGWSEHGPLSLKREGWDPHPVAVGGRLGSEILRSKGRGWQHRLESDGKRLGPDSWV